MLAHAMIFALAAALLANGNAASIPQPESALEVHFIREKRVVFRAWGARSNLVPSLDGRTLYFCENGPDGLVLKSADLWTGEVSVHAPVGGAYYNVATIPDDSDHLLLGDAAGWSNRAFTVVVLDLRTGEEKALDIGEEGGDGRLIVSPSGKYLVTGVDYACHTGDRDCFADYLAVISLETGQQEYRYKVPVTKAKSIKQPVEDGRTVELTPTTPSRLEVAWAESDTLVFSPSSVGRQAVVLQRERSGSWSPSKAMPRNEAKGQPQKLTPGVKSLSIARSPDATPVTIDPTVLFGPELGRISTNPLDGKILFMKETPDKDGWELVEVVGLKWKGGGAK